ncbi:MAG: GNAT family N-acetyltransferase [Pseudomonadota bacterium]
MTVTFRASVRADVPAVLDLLREDHLGIKRELGGLEEYYAAWDEMNAQDDNTLYVGEDASRIVATFQLTFIIGLSHRATRRAQIESVRVAADLRGQGIGHALMAEAERLACAGGCGMIQLTSHAQRDRAQAFYAALGYLPSHVGFKKAL